MIKHNRTLTPSRLESMRARLAETLADRAGSADLLPEAVRGAASETLVADLPDWYVRRVWAEGFLAACQAHLILFARDERERRAG